MLCFHSGTFLPCLTQIDSHQQVPRVFQSENECVDALPMNYEVLAVIVRSVFFIRSVKVVEVMNALPRYMSPILATYPRDLFNLHPAEGSVFRTLEVLCIHLAVVTDVLGTVQKLY